MLKRERTDGKKAPNQKQYVKYICEKERIMGHPKNNDWFDESRYVAMLARSVLLTSFDVWLASFEPAQPFISKAKVTEPIGFPPVQSWDNRDTKAVTRAEIK